VRRLDLAHGAPRREPGDVLRDVVPGRAAVARVPDLAVVRAGPDEAALDLRRRDREHQLAVELAEVVLDDAARGDDTRRVTRGEVGAEDLPRLPPVVRLEDDLAAVVHRLVVERVDRERRRPVAAVLELLRRRVERVPPWRDRARGLRLRVPAGDRIAVAARPHDVGVREVGEREARLAAADAVVPRGGREAAPATESEASEAA